MGWGHKQIRKNIFKNPKRIGWAGVDEINIGHVSEVPMEVAGGGDIYLHVGHGFDTQNGSLQLKLFEHH